MKEITEIKVIKKVRELKKRVISPLVVKHIESVTSNGLHDLYIAYDGVGAFVEIKAPACPKKDCTKLFGSSYFLNKYQIANAVEFSRVGIKTFLLVATTDLYMLYDMDFIRQGYLNEFKNATLGDFKRGVLTQFLVYKSPILFDGFIYKLRDYIKGI